MGLDKLWIVFVVCLVCTTIGFKNYVWFLSIGYGLAVAGASLTIGILFHNQLTWINIFQILVLVLYGLRLAFFLLYREKKSATYRKTMKTNGMEKKVSLPVSIMIWLGVSLLYVAQTSPYFYNLYNQNTNKVFPLIGAIITLFGAIIEMVADYQKSAQKKINPNKVAMDGLYKLCRCPNYWGEITVWLGVFIGGFTSYKSIGQLLLALIGFLLISYVMIDGAKRLEIRQDKRNGQDEDYIEYCKKTPIIIPFLPIYHLAHKE